MNTTLIGKFYVAIGVATIIPIYLKTRQIITQDRKNKQKSLVISALFTPLMFIIIGALLHLYKNNTKFIYFPLLWLCIITFIYKRNQSKICNEEIAADVRQILSPTFNENDILDWTCRSLLVPHEVIRDGLGTLISATDKQYYQSANIELLQCKMSKFFDWYNSHYICVYNHHRDEEDTYFPWLETQTEKLPPKISQDHASMNGVLDGIKNAEHIFKSVKNKTRFMQELEKLHELCVELKEDMEAHLNEEEETIPDLLKKYKISQFEEAKIINKIVQNLGLSGNKIFLPWIIDMMYNWGGQEIVTEFADNVPAPILLLNYLFWIPHYQRHNQQIVKEIIS